MTNVRTVKWHLDFSFWNVTPMSLLTRYSFLCHQQPQLMGKGSDDDNDDDFFMKDFFSLFLWQFDSGE